MVPAVDELESQKDMYECQGNAGSPDSARKAIELWLPSHQGFAERPSHGCEKHRAAYGCERRHGTMITAGELLYCRDPAGIIGTTHSTSV
jgi:hypothetical protein